MAQFARGGETGRGVRRARGARVILLVARVAQGAIQRIIVVDVAVGAEPRRHGVRSGQLEASAGVIECAVRPQDCVVAGFARRRECRCDVVHRRSCVVVVRLVARDASRAGQVVIVVNVAIGTSARRNRMRASQRESSGVVIERSIEPRAGAVALVASLREVRRDVVRVGRALVILQVTAYASSRIQGVVIVDVAIGTGTRWDGVQSRQRKSRAVVIECRVQPAAGVVTLIAGLREIRGDVVRIVRALIILQVTADASCRIQAVVVVDVAIGAGTRRYSVQPGERESSGCVVEGCVHPVGGVVTLVAGLREIRRHVVGTGCALIVLQVARHARRACQVVVVVHVTIGAGARRNRVESGQSKSCGGVVELGISPRHGIVALLARRGESTMRNRRRRVVEVCLVTTDAGRIGDVVVVVDVAIRASPWRNHVGTRQRETRLGVIEGRRLPSRGVVTDVASLRKAAGHVVGIRGALEIFQVAGDAGGASQVVIVVGVAIGASARWNSVCTGQREVHAGVVESRGRPARSSVARFASGREAQRRMVGIRRSLVILHVATGARRIVQGVVAVHVTIGTAARRDSM